MHQEGRMRLPTDTAVPGSQGCRPVSCARCNPSPALLARAAHTFARLLAEQTTSRNDMADDDAEYPETTAGQPRGEARDARPCAHTGTHTVLYDPDGLIEAHLPFDREPYESLVETVLAWVGPDTLTPRDCEQIALQLTGHARAVMTRVERCVGQWPKDSAPRLLADVVLREADGRLSLKPEGTKRCVQNRARLVRALYAHLDRLQGTPAQPT
jgi:hypothetical protein